MLVIVILDVVSCEPWVDQWLLDVNRSHLHVLSFATRWSTHRIRSLWLLLLLVIISSWLLRSFLISTLSGLGLFLLLFG